jgi:hypothetical protein
VAVVGRLGFGEAATNVALFVGAFALGRAINDRRRTAALLAEPVERSWLVPEGARRPVAIALVAITIAAFVLLGLAVAGVPGIRAIWPVLGVTGAVASALTLVLFWNTQLVAGLAIDAVVLVLALWQPAWTAQLGG